MTIAQRQKFFALCDDLNIDKEYAKEEAKKRYPGVEHFTDLTTAQLDPLIRALEGELKGGTTPYRLQAEGVKDYDGSFPDEMRVWDQQNNKMFYDLDILSMASFLHTQSWEPTAEPERFHFMQFTGRVTQSGAKIYDYDLVKSFTGRIYIVQWNWKACAWGCYDTETDEELDLGLIGRISKIGNTYEGTDLRG